MFEIHSMWFLLPNICGLSRQWFLNTVVSQNWFYCTGWHYSKLVSKWNMFCSNSILCIWFHRFQQQVAKFIWTKCFAYRYTWYMHVYAYRNFSCLLQCQTIVHAKLWRNCTIFFLFIFIFCGTAPQSIMPLMGKTTAPINRCDWYACVGVALLPSPKPFSPPLHQLPCLEKNVVCRPQPITNPIRRRRTADEAWECKENSREGNWVEEGLSPCYSKKY